MKDAKQQLKDLHDNFEKKLVKRRDKEGLKRLEEMKKAIK